MRTKKPLMLPVHFVVPGTLRKSIENAAETEGVSLGTIARELLTEGLRARGIEC